MEQQFLHALGLPFKMDSHEQSRGTDQDSSPDVNR